MTAVRHARAAAPASPRRSGSITATASLLRLALALVAAVILGLLTLVGVALVSARPMPFLLAGLGVFVAATAAGSP